MSQPVVDRRRLLCTGCGCFYGVVANTLGTLSGRFGNGEREDGKARADGMGDMFGEERPHNGKADAG